MRRLILDLDGILSETEQERCGGFARVSSEIESYRQMGFTIVLTSSADLIEPDLFRKLEELQLVYDEIRLGIPSSGPSGLVIDDKAVTPQEFFKKDYGQIRKILDGV